MDRPTLERCVIEVTEAYANAKLAPTMPAAADIMEAAVLKVVERDRQYWADRGYKMTLREATETMRDAAPSADTEQ